jgi:hypothetical protein
MYSLYSLSLSLSLSLNSVISSHNSLSLSLSLVFVSDIGLLKSATILKRNKKEKVPYSSPISSSLSMWVSISFLFFFFFFWKILLICFFGVEFADV